MRHTTEQSNYYAMPSQRNAYAERQPSERQPSYGKPSRRNRNGGGYFVESSPRVVTDSPPVASHNQQMRKTDRQRRSVERRAGVLIRLSTEQRAALNAAAAERGISVQELAEQRLRPVITKQLRSA
jgi:hypothetical protein